MRHHHHRQQFTAQCHRRDLRLRPPPRLLKEEAEAEAEAEGAG